MHHAKENKELASPSETPQPSQAEKESIIEKLGLDADTKMKKQPIVMDLDSQSEEKDKKEMGKKDKESKRGGDSDEEDDIDGCDGRHQPRKLRTDLGGAADRDRVHVICAQTRAVRAGRR